MTGKLELTLLGQVDVRLNGQPLTGFYSGKAQALLFYLAVTGQTHTRPALAGLLWADILDTDALMNLRQVLTNLRKLAGPYLTITRQTVALNRVSDYWLDVAAFQAGLVDLPGPPDVEKLRQAVELYQGDFLEGFYVRDAPLFEEWMLAQRARLRELALSALRKLAIHHTRRGDDERGLSYTRRLLELEPWHEEAHRRLMLLLARSGQRSAALAHYEMYRQLLREEFKIEPSAGTIALYERIRIARSAEYPRLPSPPTPFINRAKELAEIVQLLDDPTVRLVTILGPGGIGKTRLALEVATRQDQALVADTCFVALESARSPDDIVTSVAKAIGFQFHGQLKPKQQLLNGLRDRYMLLVLDNFEHLSASGPLLSEILESSPGTKILTTSRERLNLYSETAFSLKGLDYPAGDRLDHLQDFNAVKLFMQTAWRSRPSFQLAGADVVHVGRICQLVEGMPLGIELAAAWLDVLSPDSLVAEIENSITILKTQARDLPERHQSIQAVFEHSWRRLTEAERTVLKKLSLFRGGFDRSATEQVAGASIFMISTLINKSLVTRMGVDRYKLHELLRQYAEEKLAAAPDDHERTLQRYCRYYAGRLHGYELENKSNPASTAGNLLNTLEDWQNIRLAWHQALAYPLISEIGQFAYFLSLFYEFRGLIHEGEETFGLALAQLRAQVAPVNPIVLVRVLTHYGWFCLSLSKLERARELLEEALALASTLDDEAHAADIGLMLHFLVWVTRLQGQLPRVRELLEKSLETCQSADYQMGIWMCTATRGEIEYDAGNYDTACQYYEQSLSLSEDAQFLVGTIVVLVLLGNVYSALADYLAAADCLRRGLILNRDLLLIAPVFTGLIGIAALFGRQGQHDLALELLVIILNHPQCSIVARHKAKLMIPELRTHLTADEINAVTEKVKRGQLSNRYIEPNFSVDTKFIDRLLELIAQAV